MTASILTASAKTLLQSLTVTLLSIGVSFAATDAVGQWSFDEGSGTTASDASGNGYHGTLRNGTGWAAGRLNGAVSFDGVDDRIAIQNLHYAQANMLSSVSVSFWMKSGQTTRCGIVDFDRSEYYAVGVNFHNASNGGGRISWDTKDDNGTMHDMLSTSVVSDGQWHHICVVFDTAAGPDKKIYVDGVLDASVDGHASGAKLGTGTTRYGILGDGSEADVFDGGGNNVFYDGSLDALYIFHRALTTSEIQALATASVNTAPVIAEGSSTGVVMDEDGSPTAFALSLNASDADGNPLSWAITTQADHGTAVVNGSGASVAIDYVPTADWNGTDSFLVAVDDGNGGTDSIAVTVTVSPRNDAPQMLVAPTVSGTAAVGQVLSASSGSWNDDRDQSPGAMTYSYQWFRADDNLGSNATAIAGMVTATYTVDAAAAGQYLSVAVTGSDDGEGLPASQSVTVNSAWIAISGGAPADDAEASWSFDEGSGSVAADSSGNGYDGHLRNGTTWVAGQSGTAVAFDGVDDRIAIAGLHYDSVNVLPAVSVSFWMKSNQTGRCGFIDFDRSDYYSVGLNFHDAGDGAGRLSWDTKDGNGEMHDMLSSTVVADGVWHHVCVVFDTSSTPDKKIYVDGVLDASVDGHAAGAKLGSGNTRYGIIGDGSEATAFDGTGNTLFYAGSLDGVRIYHRALSASDIQAQANPGASNAAPVIAEGSSINVTMDEDGEPTGFALALNASDGDGDNLTWSVATAAGTGSASVSGSNQSATVSYTPNANSNGSDSFVVAVSDGKGGSDSIAVNVTVSPRNDPPQPTSLPSISGSAQVGQTLTANAGAWNDAIDQTPGSLSYAYQWRLADDAAGTNAASIAGASAATYTVAAADDGKYLSVRVTASDDGEGLPSSQSAFADSVWVAVSAVANAGPKLAWGTVTGVGTSWQTITLSENYSEMVVVATPLYDNSNYPAVPRVRHAGGSTFEVKMDLAYSSSYSSGLSGSGYTVHYLVAEAGVYTQATDGITMEAARISMSSTDANGSWGVRSYSYQQGYSAPVVVGQVLSANDAWSCFWSCGAKATDPVTAAKLSMGKHVGSDPDKTRATETVGYLVFEAGATVLSTGRLVAGVGADTIEGMDNGSQSYGLSGFTTVAAAVASMPSMDGGDGAWPVWSAVTTSALSLVCDEDQLVDTERLHTTEQVAYVVIGNSTAPVNQPPVAVATLGITIDIVDSDYDGMATVPLDGSLSSDPDGSIVSYVWDSGHSGALVEAPFAVGEHTVTLTVTDDDGATDTDTVTFTVQPGPNRAPVAVASASSLSGDAPFSVTFDASGSSDADGDTMTYSWDFGDGSTGGGVNASHTYTAVGSYDAIVTVDDQEGGSDTATVTITVGAGTTDPQLAWGVVDNVATGWQTITLPETYTHMVVVVTPAYDSSKYPAVPRVRNASGNSFEVCMALVYDSGYSSGLSGNGYSLHYLVAEAGVYTQAEHGITMEAALVDIAATDGKTAGWSVATPSYNYQQSYNSPVVIGQVQSVNDAWSCFWSCGDAVGTPPSASTLSIRKHVGADPDQTRGSETIGYLVFESGASSLANCRVVAGLGGDTIVGMDDGAVSYGLSGFTSVAAAVGSMAAMDGGDGGWPVWTDIATSSLSVVCDEDQYGDTERNHTTEQIAYVVVGDVVSSGDDLPSLVIAGPNNGAELTPGSTTPISAEIHYPDGQPSVPTSVRFEVNGAAIGDQTTGADDRAHVDWTPEIPGAYTLRAFIDNGAGQTVEDTINVTVASAETVLYRETFAMQSGDDFRRPVVNFDWSGYAWYDPDYSMIAEHGDRCTGSVGLTPVNCDPYVEADAQDGALYVSGTDRTIMLYSTEYQDLDVNQLSRISFQLTARQDTPVYLAIRIDDNWYVSSDPYVIVADNLIDEIVSGPEAFEQADFDLRTTGFNNLILLETGIIKRGTAGPFPLPSSGMVTGFGTFTEKNYSNKYAIDDYTIYGSTTVPSGSFAAQVPTSSAISPLFLEGSMASGNAISASAGSEGLTVGGLSDRHFYVNAPLNASSPVSVSISDSAVTVTRPITWTVTSVAVGGEVKLRVGDSLLLEWPAAATQAQINNGCGVDDIIDLNAGRIQAYTFSTAGYYSVVASDDGAHQWTLDVTAIGVSVPSQRSCEFTYTRDFTLGTVEPAGAADNLILWSPSASRVIDVVPGASSSDPYRLTPLTHGVVPVATRLGSTGPILATENIQVFELRTSAEQYLGVIETFPDGSVLVGATLTMTPLVLGLDVRLHMYAPGITFEDSTLDMSILSDAFTPDAGNGTLPYRMIMDPDTFQGGPCHTIMVFEGDVQVGGE